MLSRPSGRPGSTSSLPGRHHHHPRTRRGRHAMETERREQPDVAGADHLAPAHQQVALLDLLAGVADVLPLLGCPADEHLAAGLLGPLEGHHRRAPLGDRRTGHDAYGGAGGQREDLGLAGGDLADDGQVQRPLGGGVGDVLEGDGVPVHAGVVEDRQRQRRQHVLGDGQPDRVHQRVLEGLHRLDPREHPFEVVLHGKGPRVRVGRHVPTLFGRSCPRRGPCRPRRGRGRPSAWRRPSP